MLTYENMIQRAVSTIPYEYARAMKLKRIHPEGAALRANRQQSLDRVVGHRRGLEGEAMPESLQQRG